MKREVDCEKPKITPPTEIMVNFKEYERLLGIEKAWKKIRSMLEGRFFGDFTVQEKIVTWMDKILKQCTKP